VADAQQIECEDEALAFIAKASEGGMRDALSIMDQAIAFGDGTPTTLTFLLTILHTTLSILLRFSSSLLTISQWISSSNFTS
ncbi:hypothetical protein IDG68_15015, partial [Staphylococcus sp. EG-SA-21]|uniref:hypothetical protein n=1 Tax=Staphylococcus sp. EG-SA-21 TaxID=2767496 RepID=UPI00197CC0DC